MAPTFKKSIRFFGLVILTFILIVPPGVVFSKQVDEALKKEIDVLSKQAEANPNDIATLFKLAERYGWANMGEDAIRIYEKIIKIEPNNLKALRSLKDFYSWTGKGDKAIETIKKIIELDPSDIKAKEDLANNYTWTSQGKKAIPLYEEILQVEPNRQDLRKTLADLYSWNDMPQQAVKANEEILKLDPDNLDIKEKLAYSYMWNNRTEEAKKLFEEILKKDPKRPKVRKDLADLYSWTARPEQAIKEYLKVMDQITVPKEKASVYGSLANSFYYAKSYQKAKEFYEKLLRIDPANIEAQKRLDALMREMKPQVFTQFDSYKAKGAESRNIQTVGFSKVLPNDYRVKMQYVNNIRTEDGVDRMRFQALEAETNKQFANGVSMTVGSVIKYYERSWNTRFEFFIEAIKSFGARLTSSLSYSKRVEDYSWDIFNQKVDRHTLANTMYYNLNKRWSFSSSVSANYYTKGQAPHDNWGFMANVSPIYHLFFKPIVDISYTYFRGFWVRKDISADLMYQYWHPRKTESHAVTAFYRQELNNRLSVAGSGTLAFSTDDDTLTSTGYAEVRYKLTKDDSVSMQFTYSRQIMNAEDSYDKIQSTVVKFSHAF